VGLFVTQVCLVVCWFLILFGSFSFPFLEFINGVCGLTLSFFLGDGFFGFWFVMPPHS